MSANVIPFRSRKQLEQLEVQQWIELIASEQGPPSAMTRLVLVSAAFYFMDYARWPSVSELVTRTALSERTVKKYMRLAIRDGWVSG